ncbi:MAG: hypothetical protein ACYC6G_06715 [Desulfobaccales bacterium]
MRRLSMVLPLLAVVLLLGAQALQAQPKSIPILPPDLAPRWAPVPEVPGVYYAPNQAQDLFQYGSQFYYYNQGLWQIAQALTGPWQVIQNPPSAFYNIGPTYFKSPPGWAKGKKTGWRGAPLPPGQMKKLEKGGALPPGQMKKYE